MKPHNIIPWLEQINNLPINQMYKQFWHNQLTQAANKADKLAKLIEQLQAYLTCCANKQYLHQLTQVSYPANLPVSQEIEQIKAQVLNHQVVIICGETGSGKTTQLPKMLFELGLANYATIGHTQPRKVAAKSLAKRIGEELTNPDLVGYKVRFQDKTKPSTSIKLMTDGILLQEIQTDKYLFQYSAIIIDEAHERSLNIDFILGYLKTILPKRPDLKLIITSATIENTKLAKFFDQAPIINVAGKTYPVDIIYQPIETEANNLNQAIYTAIKSCLSIEHGNILVFLPGEREIKDCISFLRKSTVGQYQLLALFSRQNEAEQAMVFKEDKRLKIIVTTNVAETSLTIPGIRFVIDSGLARLKRYNSRNKVEQLQIEKISQASSKQRAGRAGRVSHGMCIRLFAEDDFKLRPEFTDPEILRSNLANVILKLINFKLGDPLHFPFLDQPDDKAFTDGYKTLYQLGALTDKNFITPSGRQIAQIAVDANLAKMLLAAGSQFNCLKEILIIVAFLAIAEPREYPLEWQQKAKEKHQLWANKQSDFMAILNLWHWYHNELAHKKSKKKLLDKCREQFVSLMRLREWHELYGQLKESLHNLNYKESESSASYQQIHQALLTGLLNNIGQKDLVEGFYLGTNNKKFFLHPNSFIDKPKWLCSAQLTQTTRLYARTNAYIEPQWLIPITAHLVKYTYSDEHWDKQRGEVVALQATLLSGLIIDKQKVSYTKINPVLARELFIKQGLVAGEIPARYAFLNHNRNVIKGLELLEDKFRLSLVIIEDELFNFYDQIIPQKICDIRSFEAWCKDHEAKLKLEQQAFIQQSIQAQQSIILYPDSMVIGSEKIKLTYTFNPDNLEDGVSAVINLTQLNRINPEPFAWLVPGLIREKLTYLIKALPKSFRVSLNPVNEFITGFLEQANISQDFAHSLANYIKTLKGLTIAPRDITNISLPQFLKFHFRILDGKKVIASGDNLVQLKHELAPQLTSLVSELSAQLEQTDIREWQPQLAQLLNEVKLKDYNQELTGYLSLVLKQGVINISVVDNLIRAKQSSRKGMLQLVKYHLKEQLKHLEHKQFPNFKQTSLYLTDIYTRDALLADSSHFLARMSVDVATLPRSQEEFNQLVLASRQKFSFNLAQFAQVINQVAGLYHKIKLLLHSHRLREIVELQLDDLIYSEFLQHLTFTNLVNFPRYLHAILKRLDKYASNPRRDQQLEFEVESLYEAWYNYVEKLENTNQLIAAEIYNFKYKIEELRVSLFAQELKTPYPVSSKRLWKELEQLFTVESS